MQDKTLTVWMSKVDDEIARANDSSTADINKTTNRNGNKFAVYTQQTRYTNAHSSSNGQDTLYGTDTVNNAKRCKRMKINQTSTTLWRTNTLHIKRYHVSVCLIFLLPLTSSIITSTLHPSLCLVWYSLSCPKVVQNQIIPFLCWSVFVLVFYSLIWLHEVD